MLTQLHPFGIDKPSGTDFTVYFRRMFAQEVPVITLDETYLHALPFFRLQLIAFPTQILPHLQLRISAQRKKATFQHILPQSPKKIRLVFLIVISGHYIYIPVLFFQTAIMPGRDKCAIQFVRPFSKYTEFKCRVTHHARIGCPPLAIFINKVLHNYFAKSLTLISHMVFDTHTVGKLSRLHRFISPHPHG